MEGKAFTSCSTMLDDKKIKELQRRVTRLIQEGQITKEKDTAHVEFFLENAAKSLDSAQLLYKASTVKEVQAAAGLKDFDGSLWVINASYYSMFYMARALLESEGIRLHGDQSIHVLTFDALVHYFYLSGKLQKRLLELYEVAKDEAGELLGKEKAHALVEDYMHEKRKRGIFTYEMGATVIKTKAKTSLDRASNFNKELLSIIKK